jgi:amidase
VLGKTVTTEFAYFRPGKTANPRNLRHTPGGSSSGSAAAVADNMVPLAFGSQTAASITRPAAFCGVVGYKPTFGTLPLVGIKPFATSLDTLGTLTRSVADAALLVSALLGIPWDASPKMTRRPRIGLCRTPWWSEAEPAAATAIDTAAAKLSGAGADVTEMTLPEGFAALVELQKCVMAFEADKDYAHEYEAGRDRLSPQIIQLIEQGRAIPRGEYLAALGKATAARRQTAGIFKRFDALLAPSAKGEAPEGLGATGDPVFSRGWTLLRLPTVALPVGKGPKGLPIGIQLLGALGDDAKLLRLSAWAEERLG